MDLLTTVRDALVQWLGSGLTDASAWQIVAYTLVMTHFTILGVTIAYVFGLLVPKVLHARFTRRTA